VGLFLGGGVRCEVGVGFRIVTVRMGSFCSRSYELVLNSNDGLTKSCSSSSNYQVRLEIQHHTKAQAIFKKRSRDSKLQI
jgi:hypothetical protein